MISFRTSKCSLFPKPFSWLGLFRRFLQRDSSTNFANIFSQGITEFYKCIYFILYHHCKVHHIQREADMDHYFQTCLWVRRYPGRKLDTAMEKCIKNRLQCPSLNVQNHKEVSSSSLSRWKVLTLKKKDRLGVIM